MRSGARLLCSLLAGIYLPLAAFAVEGPAQIVGDATDQRTGELLYREFYHCRADGVLCTVMYRDAAGELIAQKELDYSRDPHVPLVVMEDVRHGRNVTLAREPEAGLVVDAGFDNFVRSNWRALIDGERVKFRLQPVDAKKPFNMRAQRDNSADCDAQKACFTVEIDSFLLGLVAPSIQLEYSLDEQKLLRFVGVSNIRSAQDTSQNVDIAYRYVPVPTSP